MIPAYVMHDDQRWRVVCTTTLDDDPAYELQRTEPGLTGYHVIVARVSECELCVNKPRTRRLKDEGFVLEFSERGASIRKARSRLRYPVSLAGIFSAAVKAHVAAARFAKAKAKGKVNFKRK